MKRKTSRRSSAAPASKKGRVIHRLNGSEHWPKTLDKLVWMLLRAGIEPGAITLSVARSLKTHRGTVALELPSAEALEYARILTYWQNEPQFLDERGAARSLALAGGGSSFRALVRKALPRSDAGAVLSVLRQYGLVSVTPTGRVTLQSSAFLPRTKKQAQFVAHTLSALEGIVDTCHQNLNARNASDSIGRLQRVAIAERFDRRYLKEYDQFLRDQATDFLLKQDVWLKRHEAKFTGRDKAYAGHVGVGVFGFRAE